MNHIIVGITSFTLAFLMLPVIIRFLNRFEIVVKPGRRNIHKEATPSFGGFPIFVSFLLASLIWVPLTEWKNIKFILLAQSIIVVFGLRDDLFPLRPIYKLAGQFLAALVVVFLADVRIGSLYGFLGVNEIPEGISYVITLVALIGITNAFNLIDGLDGLAGSIATLVFLTFGVWFYLVGDTFYAMLALALVGAILAFLIFNWQPSKIFMGDTGSLFLGLTLAMFTIHFMRVNDFLPESSAYRFSSTIGVAACIIIVPLVDTLRIIVLRLLRGQSPFAPDKSHIHHSMMRLGMTHSEATLILVGVNAGFISLAVIFNRFGDLILLPGVIALSSLLSVVLDRQIIKRVYR
jgi:UDP-GlcNAc:undecaprenyl-phosphate/decaprenyl-phosphate GlcNAc-1-phosphate transferase